MATVTNDSPFPFRHERDFVGDALVDVHAVTRVAYSLSNGCTLFDGQSDAEFEKVRWPTALTLYPRPYAEVSVVGDIVSETPFTRRDLRLTLPSCELQLRAFGPRTWVAGPGGELSATAPAATKRVRMDWTRAFGGAHDFPPGVVPTTGLPGPSTRQAFADNPEGTGFYTTAEQARGQPLPQLERPEAGVTSWSDHPSPGCWAPLPPTSALCFAHLQDQGGDLVPKGRVDESPLVDATAAAPPELRTPLHPGDRLALQGMTDDALEVVVPTPPFHWTGHTGALFVRFVPALSHLTIWPERRVMVAFFRTRVVIPLIRRDARAAVQRTGSVPQERP